MPIIFKCKMCGGDLEIALEMTVGTCRYCDTQQTLPKASDERRANLFNRANHFRRQNDFDKAVQAYENILNEDNADAEAHWGVVLSRYGIEYVQDPASSQRIPTCHRVQSESILADADYLAALENASDPCARLLYEEEAKKISEIQKGILAISGKEEPYDVFLCYKETTDAGSRTQDSIIAQDIYYQLTNDGYRVFFAKITLEDKLGQQYEPYIFNALGSAKVMLVVGTKPEYFNAVWVKNEWSRYLALMKTDRSRLLIPCYRDMDAYDIPDELSALQSQDMSKIGFVQDLLRGLKKVLDIGKSSGNSGDFISDVPTNSTASAPGVESLMKRGCLFLEDSDWEQADEYFNRVLDIDPEYAPAYIGKLCVDLKINVEASRIKYTEPVENMSNYQKALRFANDDYRNKLVEYKKATYERNRYKQYTELVQAKKKAPTEDECKRLAVQFRSMNGYEDSQKLADECDEQYCILKERRIEQEKTKKEYQVKQEEEKQKSKQKILEFSNCISAGFSVTFGLKTNGTVIMVGKNLKGRCNTDEWYDIIAISTGWSHIVGLNANGKVIAVGKNNKFQCNTGNWRDIIMVSAGYNHTVGLQQNGTVIAVGDNKKGQCNVDNWRDIVAISAGYLYTIGLKSNGSVVIAGENELHIGGSSYNRCDIGSWRNIIAISAGSFHSVGLEDTGRVIAVGSNKYLFDEPCGQCDTEFWGDIISISVGDWHTIGLTATGKVVAVGYNKYGQCNTQDWRDIVAISAGGHHTVGLKKDGTVIATGRNMNGECYTNNWNNVSPPNKEHLLEQANIRRVEEQKFIEQSYAWQQQGLCRYCGGQIGGLFGKKCKSCGKTIT